MVGGLANPKWLKNFRYSPINKPEGSENIINLREYSIVKTSSIPTDQSHVLYWNEEIQLVIDNNDPFVVVGVVNVYHRVTPVH